MIVPEIGSRWIHKGCKRIAIVTGVCDARAESPLLIEYVYKRTAGTGDLMRVRKIAKQTMPARDFVRLFTKRAA